MPKRTLPGLGLEAFFDLGENGWNDEFDENMRKLSFMADGRVKSRSTSLPGTGTAGDVYIVPAADVNGNQIAIWDGPSGAEAWVYYPAKEGWAFYVEDENLNVQWGGTAWGLLIPSPTIGVSVSGFYPSGLGDGVVFFKIVFAEDVDFADNFAGSTGDAGSNPTATAEFDVLKNGVSIGDISVSTGGVFTFTTDAGAVSFTSGDVLTIVGPATADATLADVSITLLGSK